MSDRLQAALERLYGTERGTRRFGLDGTRALLHGCGHPQRRFRAVHVGGTNGKGSVCVLVERVLRATGLRTGLFTSPHLVDFRERIRVAGRWIAEDCLLDRLAHLDGLGARSGRTFFEACTALAFSSFAAAGVEWAVVEVGIGGRLDCTNVLEPEIAAVTNVGLDHTELLGDTHRAIAAEKAGIAKAAVPFVSGVEHPEAAVEIERVARAAGADFVRAASRVRVVAARCDAGGTTLAATAPPWGGIELRLGLRGAHQVDNAAVALAVLAELASRGLPVAAAEVVAGFAAARWPGRLEPSAHEPRLWWDGAHNADAARRLVRAWRADLALPPPAVVVVALSRDKDAP